MNARMFPTLLLLATLAQSLGAQVALEAAAHPLASNPDFTASLVSAVDAPTDDPARSYEFDGQFAVHVSQTADDQTLPTGTYSVHWRASDTCLGVQGDRTFGSEVCQAKVVVDPGRNCRYTMVRQPGTEPLGFRAPVDDGGIELRFDVEFGTSPETRTIAGHTCTLQTWNEAGTHYEAWVTTEATQIPAQLTQLLGPSGLPILGTNAPEGQVLEVTLSGANRAGATTYTVQEIQPEKQHTIRAAGVDFGQQATLNQ